LVVAVLFRVCWLEKEWAEPASKHPVGTLDALFEGKPSRRPCETNRDDPFVYILQDPHGSITPSPLDNMRGLEYYLHDMMHNNAGSDGQDQQAKGGDEPD
jgi:hypothetical protein